MKLPPTRNCRYCGGKFYPTSPRQRVCENLACRRKRHAEKMRRYRHKLKVKKILDFTL